MWHSHTLCGYAPEGNADDEIDGNNSCYHDDNSGGCYGVNTCANGHSTEMRIKMMTMTLIFMTVIITIIIMNLNSMNQHQFQCYYCEKTKFCGKRPIIKPKTSECEGDWYSYKQCTRKSYLLFGFSLKCASLQICTLFHKAIKIFSHQGTLAEVTAASE